MPELKDMTGLRYGRLTVMCPRLQNFVVGVGDGTFDVFEGRRLNREPLGLVDAYRLAGNSAAAVPDDHDRRRRRDAADAPPRR
jgi:hypothetical protein